MRPAFQLSAVVAVALVASCTKGSSSSSEGGANKDVMTRLSPSCAACHGPGSNKPFFASLASFEQLLVYNTRYVVPGDPDKSELLNLLAGMGTGSFKQMPLSGAPFAKLDADGKTEISMKELRAWIAQIDPSAAPVDNGVLAPTATRLTAEQITQSLYDQLGLTEADFFGFDGSGAVLTANVDRYPIRSPDAVPFNPNDHQNTPSYAFARFSALGGPDWLGRVRRNGEVSPVFLQTVVQTAQAWCALSVAKGATSPLFVDASPTDTSAAAPDKIQKNIGSLYLRMIGEVATDDDVKDLYQSVYLAYEPQSPAVAWTAVCASLIRHPLWLTY